MKEHQPSMFYEASAEPFQPARAFVVEEFQPHKHARVSDPDTSHAAAKAVSDATVVQARVLALLKTRPMTDEELIDAYQSEHGDRRDGESVASPRKRRSDLATQGLVKDSGDRRKLRSGRNGIVWCVA